MDSSNHPSSNKHEALRVLKLAFPYFVEQPYALLALIALVIITLSLPTIYVIFSYVQRDIFNALQIKNQHDFNIGIRNYILIIVAAVPITVVKNFMTQYLCASWRKNMTKKLLREYYSARTFYTIDLLNAVDNPDQRICDDVKNFTTTSMKFFLLFSETLMNLALFALVLLSIYPYLFFMVLLYSILGTIITHIIGRALYNLYFTQLTKEANLRYGLIRTRENAESIAFYDETASLEYKNIWTLFQYVYHIQIQVIVKQLHLETFTKSYEYFAFVFPLIILAPSYFAGVLTLGQITQANDAFFNIRSDFSVLVNYYEELSLFSATLYRIECLIAVMDKHHHHHHRFQQQQQEKYLNDKERDYYDDYDNNEINGHNNNNNGNNSNGSNSSISNISSSSLIIKNELQTGSSPNDNNRVSNNSNNSNSNSTVVGSKASGNSSSHNNRYLYAPLVDDDDDDDIESSIAVVSSSSSYIQTEYRRPPSSAVIHPSVTTHSDSSRRNNIGSSNSNNTSNSSSSSSSSNSNIPTVILECNNICIHTPDNRVLLLKILSEQLSSSSSSSSYHQQPLHQESSLLQYQYHHQDQPSVHLEQQQVSAESTVGIGYSPPILLYQPPKMTMMMNLKHHSASQQSVEGGISFQVLQGQSVLISGPSGCGKSSLLRALAGLWNKGSGRIIWSAQYKKNNAKYNKKNAHDTTTNTTTNTNTTQTHHHHHHRYSAVFFLPQKSFNIIGTLRQNVIYPHRICTKTDRTSNTDNNDDDEEEEEEEESMSRKVSAGSSRDQRLLHILHQVGLESLVTRTDCGLDAVNDWSKVLSVGESQRIGFARVLYHQPSFVLLDESTSALDIEIERQLYELLMSHKIDYLSIGHRPSLIQLHAKHIKVMSS